MAQNDCGRNAPLLGITTSSLCLGQSTILSNGSADPAGQISYHLSDGTQIGTGSPFNYIPSAVGSVQVYLRRDLDGCADSTGLATLTINGLPTAAFGITGNNNCSEDAITFTNSSTNSGGGTGGLSFNWDFGDGEGSADFEPTHEFVAVSFDNGFFGSQNFNVNLTVTNNNGCESDQSQTVSVLEKPLVIWRNVEGTDLFASCASDKSSGNDTTEASFINIAANSTDLQYNIDWDFNGDTDFIPFGGLGNEPDTFRNVLIGEIAVDNYQIVIEAEDPTNGCVNTASFDYQFESRPNADIGGPGSLGFSFDQCIPSEVPFLNNSTNISATTQVTFYFDDGDSLNLPNGSMGDTVRHVFNTTKCQPNGTNSEFQVRLVVSNACATVSQVDENVELYSPPLADFSADTLVCEGETITFSNHTIPNYCSDNSNTNYRWDFGDGTAPQTQPNVAASGSQGSITHTYSSPGTYTVVLTAQNAGTSTTSCGQTTDTLVVLVPEPPTGIFDISNGTNTVTINSGNTGSTFTVSDPCAPVSIDLTDRSTGDDLVINWTVSGTGGGSFSGGGSSSSNPNETLNITQPGVYTISQEVSNACGTHICEVEVMVIGEPNSGTTEIICSAEFAPDPTQPGRLAACEPALLDLGVNNNDTTITAWSWVINDDGGSPITPQPASANTEDPGAVTLSAGTYQVVLSATNQCSTEDITLDLLVQDRPTAGFEAAGQNGESLSVNTANSSDTLTLTSPCIPYQLELNDQSTGTNRFVSYSVGPGSGFSLLGSAQPNSEVIEFTTAGVYTVTQTVRSTCDTVTASVVLVLRELPVASNTNVLVPANFLQSATADTLYTACAPAPLDLAVSNSDTSISNWSWSLRGINGTPDPAALPNATTQDPGEVTLAAGSYALQLIAGNVCGDLTINLALEVADPPVAQVGPRDTVCANEAASLGTGAAVTGVSYQWTALDGGAQPLSPLSLNTQASNTAGGLYTYQLIATAGQCADTTSQQIVVDDLPGLAIGAADTAVCIGSPDFTLSASPAGGTWSGAGGISPAGAFSPATAGTFGVSYQFTDPGTGCTATAPKNITVNTLPTVEAGPAITFCEIDMPLSLNDNSSPAGGSWSGSSAITNASGEYNPSLRGIGLDTLTYTFTDANGCVNQDVLEITVEALQVANAGSDDRICRDSVLLLSGFSPANLGVGAGNWIISDPQLRLQGDTLLTASATGTFTLTYEYGEGVCLTSDSRQVEVLALPNVFGGADLDTICLDEGLLDLSLTSGLTPATGGNWAGEGISNPTGTFDPVQAAGSDALPKTVSLFYTASLPNGCDSTYERRITINPLPQPAFSTLSPAVYCINTPYTFANTTPTIAGQTLSYEWDFGDGLLRAANADGSGSFTFTTPGSYTISLFARSSRTCEEVATETIEVVTPVTPSFEVATADSLGCAPLEINFSNTTTGFAPSYRWDFGNGVTDTAANPGPQMYQSNIFGDTTYTISLRTDNLCGTEAADTTIIVSPEPTVRFLAAQDTICADFPLLFNNFSTGNPEAFRWDFGDGSAPVDTAFAGFLEHGFPFEGIGDTTYIVTLRASNGCGADTDSLAIVVEAKDVTAFFAVDDPEGCAPHTVQLNSNQIGENTLIWDQGLSGGTVLFDSLNRSFTYPDPGTYMPSLEVRNGCDIDTFTTVITVLESPLASFSGGGEYCDSDTITLLNTSSSNFGSSWELGDGNSSNQINPQPFVYADSGSYQVQLTVRNPVNNCPATATETITVRPTPVASFSVGDSLCQFEAVQLHNTSVGATAYAWYPGTEGPLPDFEPAPIFGSAGTVTIRLMASNSFGCESEFSQTISINPAPEPAFSLSPRAGCSPLLVEISNETSSPAAAPGSLSWDFGNGRSQTGFEPPAPQEFSNTGNSPQDFMVSLTASTGTGCVATYRDTVTVWPVPVADFDISPGPVVPLDQASITFSNQTDISGTTSYTWDPGDGSAASTLQDRSNYQHTYTDNGSYTVTLIAVTANGCSDTLQRTVEVTPVPPVAEFDLLDELGNSLDPLSGCTPLIANFRSQSRFADGFFWDFGRFAGDTSGQENPPPTLYEVPGTYLVTLTVFNEVDTLTSTPATIVVHPLPDSDFELPVDTVFLPHENDPLMPINRSTGAQRYLWDFGDGSDTLITVGNEVASHVYAPDNPGVYLVRLRAESQFGCLGDEHLERIVVTNERIFYAPNAFSPNGDNYQDEYQFVIKGFKEDAYKLRIFNTQGDLVFSSTDPNERWDGSGAPSGVYAFQLNVTFFANDRGEVITGEIHLIR